jgi:hypothetical protein
MVTRIDHIAELGGKPNDNTDYVPDLFYIEEFSSRKNHYEMRYKSTVEIDPQLHMRQIDEKLREGGIKIDHSHCKSGFRKTPEVYGENFKIRIEKSFRDQESDLFIKADNEDLFYQILKLVYELYMPK